MIFQFSKNDRMIFSLALNTMFTDFWEIVNRIKPKKVVENKISTWYFGTFHDIPGIVNMVYRAVMGEIPIQMQNNIWVI